MTPSASRVKTPNSSTPYSNKVNQGILVLQDLEDRRSQNLRSPSPQSPRGCQAETIKHKKNGQHFIRVAIRQGKVRMEGKGRVNLHFPSIFEVLRNISEYRILENEK